jgi:LAGLIDADG DNA endonuclease family protein
MVKEFFGVGGIYKDGDRHIKYSVRSLKDLAIIIKHFEEYPLLSKKRADFELFKDSVQLRLNRSHITEEGLKKIISLKASMNTGLSCSLKAAFPNVVPRPLVLNKISYAQARAI